MRGKKVKELRRAFRAVTGRAPNKMVVVERREDGNVAYLPSEWRRLKTAYRRSDAAD